MQIVLYMLKAWLGASRTHLSRHLLDRPLTGPVPNHIPGNLAGVGSDGEREELKTALIATQESAVVQIILEICLETEKDQVGLCPFEVLDKGWCFFRDVQVNVQKLSELREIQCIVCSFLHQVFISDPNLVKLVHFQVAFHDFVFELASPNNLFPSSFLINFFKGLSSGFVAFDDPRNTFNAHLPWFPTRTARPARTLQAVVRRRSHISSVLAVCSTEIVQRSSSRREYFVDATQW